MAENDDRMTPQEGDAMQEATPGAEQQPAASEATEDPPPEAQEPNAMQTLANEVREINPAELKESDNGHKTPLDLDFILDIPLKVTVEVGRTRMLIQELLQLGKGSVIELDKLLGEPFEVLVNNKLVARGEVVIVNDRFGVRLTDIISQNERVQSLA